MHGSTVTAQPYAYTKCAVISYSSSRLILRGRRSTLLDPSIFESTSRVRHISPLSDKGETSIAVALMRYHALHPDKSSVSMLWMRDRWLEEARTQGRNECQQSASDTPQDEIMGIIAVKHCFSGTVTWLHSDISDSKVRNDAQIKIFS